MDALRLSNETLADQIYAACVLEAAARKPGNVHPGACFRDLSFQQLVESAAAVAPILSEARRLGLGPVIERAVLATRARVRTNSNLGIILLIAPLAAVPEGRTSREGIGDVLKTLTHSDAELVYRAIRAANPGGLGEASDQDVASPPTAGLIETMALAADRDLVARQYATDFDDVLGRGRELFLSSAAAPDDWETAIISTQLELMASRPDTLIARKCGADVAEESQRRARQVLEAGWPEPTARESFAALDRWLRADGHRRNPGATADLLAAILFSAIRDHLWTPPRTIAPMAIAGESSDAAVPASEAGDPFEQVTNS